MKVIHIESGLGNQMLSYCEYLAMKKANPQDNVYIENIIYDISECNDIICQWNGYELERIFGIKAPNIKEYFTEGQWNQILADVRRSEFWLHNWNYPVYITKAFQNAGFEIKNIRGDFEKSGLEMGYDCNRKKTFKDILRSQDWYIYLRYIKNKEYNRYRSIKTDYRSQLFIHSEENLFTGQLLYFKNIHSGIECIEQEIRDDFRFPSIQDKNNENAMNVIQSCNSVAIHARRGDMLGYNYPYYRFGYFKRAVKYIRKHVSNPVFFIFCDPESVSWAKENAHILGLDLKKDIIHFINWNKGTDSFRDMQLMSECKHQIITNSSFGWWGAWLNKYPNKITISPDYLINTTTTL